MRNQYITVTALTKYLKKKMDIDPHLKQVLIKGEISNFKHHSRGHMYMTIKDQGAQIRAVMFASDNRHLKFLPEDGMQVLIEGNVSVFEAFGQYQLYIRSLEPDGKGALYAAYEQTKEKMEKEGYFDQQYKKEIPAFPGNIAIITSPTGAAIRDIISTLKRRFPIVQLTVIPVMVQGEEAVNSILTAISKVNHMHTFDTIIIGRGGGSIEDLWAFNDERVAKAIFHSDIPVISGIGHETDFTISDFTSDVRAVTPTGAAELAAPSLIDINTHLRQMQATLTRSTQYIIQTYKNELENYVSNLQRPNRLFREKEQYLDKLTDDMLHHLKRIYQNRLHTYQSLSIRFSHLNPKKQYQQINETKKELTRRLDRQSKQILQAKKQQLQLYIHQLALLNPLEIMKRGYAIPYNMDGDIVSSTAYLYPGDDVTFKLKDGTLACSIQEVWRDEKDGR